MEFTVHSPIKRLPGLYFQLYDFPIGGVGTYFGLQTDVARPTAIGHVGQGTGLLFSRWGLCSVADAKPAADGWLEAASHEGNFVGVRRSFDWGPGRFQARLSVVDTDSHGDWFEFSTLNLETGRRRSAGCLRFPRGNDGSCKMVDGGGTWLECYSGANSPMDLPFFYVTMTSVVALDGGRRHPYIHARSTYTDYPNLTGVDVNFDATTRHVHMQTGPEVKQLRPAGPLV